MKAQVKPKVSDDHPTKHFSIDGVERLSWTSGSDPRWREEWKEQLCQVGMVIPHLLWGWDKRLFAGSQDGISFSEVLLHIFLI